MLVLLSFLHCASCSWCVIPLCDRSFFSRSAVSESTYTTDKKFPACTAAARGSSRFSIHPYPLRLGDVQKEEAVREDFGVKVASRFSNAGVPPSASVSGHLLASAVDGPIAVVRCWACSGAGAFLDNREDASVVVVVPVEAGDKSGTVEQPLVSPLRACSRLRRSFSSSASSDKTSTGGRHSEEGVRCDDLELAFLGERRPPREIPSGAAALGEQDGPPSVSFGTSRPVALDSFKGDAVPEVGSSN